MRVVVALVAAVAAAGLWLPWWSADHPTYLVSLGEMTDQGTERLRGVDVAGSWAVTLVIGAAVAAVVAAVVPEFRARWWLIAAAGIAQAAAAAVVVASWGLDLGSASTLVAGLVVAVIAVRALATALPRRLKATPAVLLLVAVPAGFVPVDTLGDTTGRDPFERLANAGPSRLLPVDDGVGLAERGAVRTVSGVRPAVLARLDDARAEPLGVVAGRLVVFSPYRGPDDDGGEVWIARLGVPDAQRAVVTGVNAVSAMSGAGTVLVETGEPHRQTVHRLDVTRLPDGARMLAAELAAVPLPTSGPFENHELGPHRLRLLDQPRAGRVAVTGPHTNDGERLDVAGPGDGGRLAAGGLDPACGLTANGPDTFLPELGAVTADGADGWWLATEDRLLHLAADGELRALPPLDLGVPESALVVDGDLHVGTREGVWRLADPRSRLEALPEPGRDCFPRPEVGGPAPLTPIAVAPHTRDVLDVTGRHAERTVNGAIEVVAADGARTPLGPRQGEEDGLLEFVPDGSGGLWWLETVVPVPDEPLARQLVHASAAGVVTRHAPVAGGGERNKLHPDLSGGVPLVGHCPPTRFSGRGDAASIPALENLKGESGCLSPVVGRDGRGWVLAQGGLYWFDPARLGPATPVVNAAGSDDVPVAVALAHGADPATVRLPYATLAFDSAGGLLVLSEDVLLGVTVEGAVTVLAQDGRLHGGKLSAVEGGAVVTLRDGTLHRLGY
ncbi:hypothetical protein [Actinophytocola algeriensis]|uniref:Uncharacterized protein n=1 Tax=Actinophytocola algeriensis TaxID=1768010 RepID=A0A7W7VEN5_9PSEU|nr:hypothetical protein [Actinophytocola algeriensis]MBB4907185.1 hypothetical protein [Actinophytocola algeriensis]MBE1478668.1 hypothetical protein [Actinophytocola algeriensis]